MYPSIQEPRKSIRGEIRVLRIPLAVPRPLWLNWRWWSTAGPPSPKAYQSFRKNTVLSESSIRISQMSVPTIHSGPQEIFTLNALELILVFFFIRKSVQKKNLYHAVALNSVTDLDCWTRILSLTIDEKLFNVSYFWLSKLLGSRSKIKQDLAKKACSGDICSYQFFADPAHQSDLMFLRIRIWLWSGFGSGFPKWYVSGTLALTTQKEREHKYQSKRGRKVRKERCQYESQALVAVSVSHPISGTISVHYWTQNLKSEITHPLQYIMQMNSWLFWYNI